MGYGELGGNGSIHWLIDADDVDEAVEKGRMVQSVRGASMGAWRQHGVDYHGKKGRTGKEDVGGNFTVRIKVPQRHRRAWLAQLKRQVEAAADGKVFEFTLPIARSTAPHTQIQICWGKTCGWLDHLYMLSRELKGRSRSTPGALQARPSI